MEYLEVLSKLAPIASAITAIIAAIFVSRQIVNIRRNREVDTLFKLITLSDSESMRDSKDWLIYELHKFPSIQDIRTDKDAIKKFTHIVHLFETMGVLVNNRYVHESLVFDKYGLLIAGAWGRLQPLISAMRDESQSYEYAENFEVLAQRYDKWAKDNPEKIGKRERLRLREARNYLSYGRHDHESVDKSGPRSSER